MPSPIEARNSIYLDFEGEGKKRNGVVPKPHIAGLFRPNSKGKSGKYTCIFFKDDWGPVSNGIKTGQVFSFNELFIELLEELEKKDSYLIYWSIHEETVLKKYLKIDVFKRVQPRLYNLHPLARRYANRKRIFGGTETARKKSLEDFFAAMYQKRPPYPPLPIGPAAACRRIDRACINQKKWWHFTHKQKSYAKDLIQYNEGDCLSTWLIAKKLANVN